MGLGRSKHRTTKADDTTKQCNIIIKENNGELTKTDDENCQKIENVTIGSEPSMLSPVLETNHVVITPELKENISSQSSTPQTSTHSEFNNEQKCQRNSKLSSPQMPMFIADWTEYLPKDVTPRTPSYLRLSSTISGYGHYSQYNAYKGIEKRSPYSSTFSLRSCHYDLTTPLSPLDVPNWKIPNIKSPTNVTPLTTGSMSPEGSNCIKEKLSFLETSDGACENQMCLTSNAVCCVNVNGQLDRRINGENKSTDVESEPADVDDVSVRDNIKDADYFLGVAEVEENRLLMSCSMCQMEMIGEFDIPEEASEKIHLAIGKANLLISEKFRQFQDLCQKHKHPDPEEKPTKLEDLQEFWEMVKLQVDDIHEMFRDIELWKQNGWREVNIQTHSGSSSSSSSSLNVSNTSTQSDTPGNVSNTSTPCPESKQREPTMSETPESSPERSQSEPERSQSEPERSQSDDTDN